jgi:hypothetical protein
MTRYSHALAAIALPCLILAPFVAVELHMQVWAVGTGTALAAVIFRLAND